MKNKIIGMKKNYIVPQVEVMQLKTADLMHFDDPSSRTDGPAGAPRQAIPLD